MSVEFEVIDIEKPADTNIIIGQAHFIKTTEDVYEALITSVPNIRFGFAFCESSGKRLIRIEGNDEELKKLAIENALKIGAGHSFVLLIRNAWPINILNTLKMVHEITSIYCATANPVQVIVAQTNKGRAILGIVDGGTPLGVEKEEDIKERREFLRRIGYKLA
ncbi:MAG: adenosine monophosphate-protein transferase [Thermoprotei archaeon]|nr:MAG: adenosine monophosphate-protein transferase [Thermoprotei archaeon]